MRKAVWSELEEGRKVGAAVQSGLRGNVGLDTQSWQVIRTLSLHSELGVCEGSWGGGRLGGECQTC